MSERRSRRSFLGASAAWAAGGAMAAVTVATRADQLIPSRISRNERQFQLGLVTYNLAADWDLSTLIQRCTAAGYAAVELRTSHKHSVEPTLSSAQRQAVKKQFADSPVKLWTLGSTCEFHSPDSAEVAQQIELAKQFIQLAVDIGAKSVKVRPNALPKEVPVEKTLEQIGRSLRTVGEVAQSAGIQITCEMHGHGTQEPVNMRRIMEIADHPAVGVMWNSNPTDVANGSIREAFQMMQRWIKSVHINELTSDYPYRELFTLLRETNYHGYTMMELQAFATKDPQDITRFMAYYKALWTELSRPA